MVKINFTNLFIALIAIGSINIMIGVYSWISGSGFQEYFWSIFIGVSLAGTAYISLKENTKNKNQPS